MVMDCRIVVVERMCARPVCCCILHHVYCILILILILGTIPISYTVDPAILHFGHLHDVKRSTFSPAALSPPAAPAAGPPTHHFLRPVVGL